MFKFKKCASLEFLVYLVLLLYSVTYEFLSGFSFYPVHDTISIFEYFYVFYNEFLVNHAFPYWHPNYLYGNESQFLAALLTYSQYFFVIIGKLFSLNDALNLFKLSLAFEKLVFLMGVFLLSREFFQNRLTRIYIGIGATLTVFWGVQICHNFRIYSLIPFIFYWIHLFIRRGSITYLLIGGVFAFFTAIGTNPYMVPVYAFIYIIFFIFELIHQKNFQLKLSFQFNLINFLLVIALAIMYFSYIDFTLHILKEVSLHSPGRGYAGEITLDSFLTHIGWANFKTHLEILYAIPTFHDNTAFIGYIPLIFLVYGIVKVQKNTFRTLLILIIVLFLFAISSSSFVASSLFYLFPGMNLYRGITLIMPIVKILILFASGFGLDYFLRNQSQFTERKWIIGIGFALVLTIVVLDLAVFAKPPTISATTIVTANTPPLPTSYDIAFYPLFNDYFYFHYVSILVVLFLCIYLFNQNSKAIVLILFYFVEIASYSSFVHSILPSKVQRDKIPNQTKNDFKKQQELNQIHKVQKYEYQEKRLYQQDLYKMRYGSEDIVRLFPFGVKYSSMYNAYYFDSCKQTYRYDFMTKPFNDLLRARYGVDLNVEFMSPDYMPKIDEFLEDYDLRSAIGCYSNKQRLVKNVVYSKIKEDAAKYIRSNSINETPVILDENRDILDSQKSQTIEQSIELWTTKSNTASRLPEDQLKKIQIQLPIKNFFRENLKFADINGDGLSDMVYVDFENQNTVYVNKNSSNGFQGFSIWLTNDRKDKQNDSEYFLVDLDKDGNSDIVFSHRNSRNIIEIWTAFSNAEQFVSLSPISFQEFFPIAIDFTQNKNSKIEFADFNGDGLLDIYFNYNEWSSYTIQTNVTLVSVQSKNQQFLKPKQVFKFDDSNRIIYINDKHLKFEGKEKLKNPIDLDQIRFSDINGDRKADFIFYSFIDKKVYVFLSTGDLNSVGNSYSNAYPVSSIGFQLSGDSFFPSQFYVLDMNRDQKADLVYRDYNGNIFFAESNGNQFVLNSAKSIPNQGKHFESDSIQFYDINGDGFLDIVKVQKETVQIHLQRDNRFEFSEIRFHFPRSGIPQKTDFVYVHNPKWMDIVFYSEKVFVSKFTANKVTMDVHLTEKDVGSWLVYLDSYHPAWRVRVNGEEKNIHKVNLAFKGVFLEKVGKNTVEFEFLGNYRTRYHIPIFLIASCLFSIGIIGMFFALLFPRYVNRLYKKA